MGKQGVRALLAAALAYALFAVCAGGASAAPASGPRETVDQGYTSTQPGTSTGMTFSGSYHAAGDPSGNPPYLRKMTFYPPEGMRYDTSVPDQCTAPDPVLQVQGPDACPDGSLLGTGTADGIFFVPLAHSFTFDRYHHDTFIANNAGEQIVMVHAEGYSITRGKFQPDGSIEFDTPTCFPSSPTGQCADEYIMQLKSTSSIPAYTRADGAAYATTPPTCPASGHWTTTIKIWWSDGSVDTVPSDQPCTAS